MKFSYVPTVPWGDFCCSFMVYKINVLKNKEINVSSWNYQINELNCIQVYLSYSNCIENIMNSGFISINHA